MHQIMNYIVANSGSVIGSAITILLGIISVYYFNKQERRYAAGQKTNVKCEFISIDGEHNPSRQLRFESRVINQSFHPVFIKGHTIDGVHAPFNLTTRQSKVWMDPHRIDAQSEAYYRDVLLDRLSVHRITINLSTGEDKEVKLPAWLNKQ